MALSPPYDILILGAAALLAAGIASQSRLARQASVHVDDELPKVFAQVRTGADRDCSLTDRGGATIRRSEPDLTKTRWTCIWLGRAAADQSLAALSGDRPAFLFIPAMHVEDPLLPAAYSASRPEDLPSMRWVQLYFDRTYRGLFLELELPAKRFADERQLGDVEMLYVEEDRLHCWDRKLRSSCPILAATIADGIVLQPSTSPNLGELTALLPTDLGRSYVLRELATPQLIPWPLPIDLSQLLGAGAGEAGAYRDRRFADWNLATATDLEPPFLALSAADVDALAADLATAIRASCRVTGCDPQTFEARLSGSATHARLLDSPS